MTGHKTVIPETELSKNALKIVSILQSAGHIAYFAGGCVRDILMNRVPADYDIATSATPDIVTGIFPNSKQVGKAFGVVIVSSGNAWFEIATFRSDASYSDGRRPDHVKFTNAETDAQRRDFTINAVFLDPATGMMHDYVNGSEDIQKKIIRTVGDPDTRFAEDHLRIMRAIRFASTLGFSIEEKTSESIRRNAALVALVSKERLKTEISRTLAGSGSLTATIRSMMDLGIMEVILPEIARLKSTHTAAFNRTLNMLEMISGNSQTLILSTLLHTMMPEIITDIMNRLRFSRKEITSVRECVNINNQLCNPTTPDSLSIRTILASPEADDAMELHRLFCLCAGKNMRNFNVADLARTKIDGQPPLPAPWINGNDLLNMGLPEGPQIKKYRNIAYRAQIDNKFPDRTGLMDWLAAKIRSDFS